MLGWIKKKKVVTVIEPLTCWSSSSASSTPPPWQTALTERKGRMTMVEDYSNNISDVSLESHFHLLTFFLSTSRMTWLISLSREGFLKTSSLQDLMTLFMVSRTAITTWRSCSVRTVSKKQGMTTSSNFSRARGGIKFKCSDVSLTHK